MRPREFEMSSRAPVSSRLDLFSSRGSDFPRAPTSVVRSLINGIDLPPYRHLWTCYARTPFGVEYEQTDRVFNAS